MSARWILAMVPLLLASVLPLPALADDESRTVARSERATVQLVSERAGLQAGSTAWFAVSFDLARGWHVYWSNPGDSGEAPHLEWTLPEGFEVGEMRFLPPERIRVGPLMNYGYHDRAVYLVPVEVPQDVSRGPVEIRVHATWLICEEICVPEEGRFTLNLLAMDGEPPVDSRHARLFGDARRALPRPSPWEARFEATDRSLRLFVPAAGLERDRLDDVWFFPRKDGTIDHAAEQRLHVGAEGMTLTIDRPRTARPIEELEGVLVIRERLDDGTNSTQSVLLAATPDAVPEPGSPGGPSALLVAVGLALLGGLLLNLMPCVFPILSMKALSFARHGKAGGMGGHGLAYTAGVLATFAAVAGVLLVAKAGGAAVGWGFQLQSPVFVALMAYLMFVIGLNLAGLFEIGGGVMGAGSSLAERGGRSGAFFTGILAVVVATPCTAPFMGVAVGWGLAQPWFVALAVMLALGFGMALPFLLLSYSPRLLRLLPKPGPWMIRFRQFLAFPMFATAAWLLWVLTVQAGDTALVAALAGAVLIAFGLWVWRSWSSAGRRARWVTRGIAVAALLGAAALVPLMDRDAPASPGADVAGDAVPFTPARLAALRAEGRPVFVNFTASWCITCLVNERAVLNSPGLHAEMAARGIVYMKADWTRRDADIARELERFGRSGVPLYVLYPPTGSSRKPVVLPQILTDSGVRDAIGKYEKIEAVRRVE